MTRTIVVGLGNPIMGDDGIGHWLVDTLKPEFPDLTFQKVIAVGWELLDLSADFDRLVIIDAMKTGEPVGMVKQFTDFKNAATLHLAASHGLDLFTSIRLGEKLYPHFPEEVIVYGIEVDNPSDFCEGFTAVVRERLNDIVEILKRDLKSFI
jgi:hydrogenase maturation protease